MPAIGEPCGAARSIADLRLNQLGEERERLLPPEIAGLNGNSLRDPLLHVLRYPAGPPLLL